MGTFEITSPDGRKFRVSGPGNKQDALDQVRARVASEDIRGGDDLAYRSTILPLGKTKEGNIVPAVPGLVKSAIGAVESLAGLPKQLISAGSAGPPGSREVTEAAIAPAADTAMAFGPTSAGAKVAKALLPKPEIPTTEELHAAGSAAYKVADQSGIQIKPEAFRDMVSDLVSELKNSGFDKDVQPKSAAAVRRLGQEVSSRKPQTSTEAVTKMVDGKRVISELKTIEKPSTPVSISEFDTIRKVAQAAAKSNEPDERRVAGIIKGAMDDFLSNITENDVVSGDIQAGAAALKQARELWGRYSKSSEIDRLFDNASLSAGNYSAAGYENALRNEFKTLARNQNRMRKFSAEEQDAIRAVAKGNKTLSALTKLGKFSPTSGFFGGVLSGEIALKAAANPALLAIPGIAAVAKYAANKMRASLAERARATVAGGKSAADTMKNIKTQKKLGRREALSNVTQRGALLGGLGQNSPLRITIPRDPNNL